MDTSLLYSNTKYTLEREKKQDNLGKEGMVNKNTKISSLFGVDAKGKIIRQMHPY
jgi:hypothetical protein